MPTSEHAEESSSTDMDLEHKNDANGWEAMPYKLVRIRFPDASSMFVSARDIAVFAAEWLARSPGGGSPVAHLVEQVLPAVEERPERLLEMLQAMPFEMVRHVHKSANWRSPAILVAQWWPHAANLNLWHAEYAGG